MVGDGHGIEAERGAPVRKLVDAAEPVEQAELGVEVQVDEVIRRDGHEKKGTASAGSGERSGDRRSADGRGRVQLP